MILKKGVTAVALGLCIYSSSVYAVDDTAWYKTVFGKDIVPEISGSGSGGYSAFEGWGAEKRTHSAKALSTSSVTIGCEGIQIESVFTAQYSNLFDDIGQAMNEPVMIIIAAASYFIGSAYEVANQLTIQITETISDLIGSCEASSKVVANFAADKIPELGKLYCEDKNAGNDRECLSTKWADSTEEFIRQYTQDLVDKIAMDLSQKMDPERDMEKYYILGEQDQRFCSDQYGSNPSFLRAVYAATSMTCFEFHTAYRLLGDLEFLGDASAIGTSNGSQIKDLQTTRYIPRATDTESLFVRLSKAYGIALLEEISSDQPEETLGHQQLQRSLAASSIDDMTYNILSMRYKAGEESLVAANVRVIADLTALKHMKLELGRIQGFIDQYVNTPDPKSFNAEVNPVVREIESAIVQLDNINELRLMRKEEAELTMNLLTL